MESAADADAVDAAGCAASADATGMGCAVYRSVWGAAGRWKFGPTAQPLTDTSAIVIADIRR
jgi:hypothetical protein